MLLATFEARAIFGLKEFSHRSYWYLLKEIQKTKNRERAKKRRKLLEDLEDKVIKILFTLSVEFLYVNPMNYEKDYYAKNVALKGFLNDLRYSRLLTEERKMYFRQIPLEELVATSYIAADFAKSQLRVDMLKVQFHLFLVISKMLLSTFTKDLIIIVNQ